VAWLCAYPANNAGSVPVIRDQAAPSGAFPSERSLGRDVELGAGTRARQRRISPACRSRWSADATVPGDGLHRAGPGNLTKRDQRPRLPRRRTTQLLCPHRDGRAGYGVRVTAAATTGPGARPGSPTVRGRLAGAGACRADPGGRRGVRPAVECGSWPPRPRPST
jgi:hypothetical protein